MSSEITRSSWEVPGFAFGTRLHIWLLRQLGFMLNATKRCSPNFLVPLTKPTTRTRTYGRWNGASPMISISRLYLYTYSVGYDVEGTSHFNWGKRLHFPSSGQWEYLKLPHAPPSGKIGSEAQMTPDWLRQTYIKYLLISYNSWN